MTTTIKLPKYTDTAAFAEQCRAMCLSLAEELRLALTNYYISILARSFALRSLAILTFSGRENSEMNLLQETIEAILDFGHTPEEIVFIGSEHTGHSCTWLEYQALADVNYNHSYGTAEVAEDLVIVFTDGEKMWRDEYDGAEWWMCSKAFVRPKTSKPIKTLFASESYENTLSACNEYAP